MRGSAILLVAASLALGACGGDDEQTSSSTSTVDKAVPDQVEKAEEAPDLPNGWTVMSDPVQGFRLGAPPGWKDGRDCLLKDASPGEVAVLCSPDKLVTLSITVDRSADGLTLNPAEFGSARGYVQSVVVSGRAGLRELAAVSTARRCRCT